MRFFFPAKKKKKIRGPSRDFDPRRGTQTLQGVQWNGCVVVFAHLLVARAMGIRRPLKRVPRERAPRKGVALATFRAHSNITPSPFLQSALVALGRAPPRRAACVCAEGPSSGQGGACACCSRPTSGPRTPHARQKRPADGGQAHTHRTVRRTWRRTRHHRGGPARAAPTRRGARTDSRRCGRERRHAPCGLGCALHTVCRTQRRNQRLADEPFRALGRAEPRAKGGERDAPHPRPPAERTGPARAPRIASQIPPLQNV